MDKKSKQQGLYIDIIFQILTNLPVETLVRFRCVSRQWYSIISDATFHKAHYDCRFRQDQVLLIASTGPKDLNTPEPSIYDSLYLSTHDDYYGNSISDFNVPFPVIPKSKSCHAIQTCHGLACVAMSTDIFICNPATREIMALPMFEDPNHCVGFGYAASTNEFKVVRLFRNPFSSTGMNYCHIFVLGTSQWREARSPPQPSFSDFGLHAPFLHGAIHFLSDSEYRNAGDAIYAFDIDYEEYSTIKFPEDYYITGEEALYPDMTWQCLNELRGSLCLTFNLNSSMHLWLLKDYETGKWVNEYIINIPEITSEFVWGEPLAIMADGDILLKLSWLDSRYTELYWYDPEDKSVTDCAMPDYTATMFVESLLPLVRRP